MHLELQSTDKRGFVDFIRQDERPGVEWGLKWFAALPELASCFAVMNHDGIVGVYYLNPYLSGYGLGVYVGHTKRRSGILKHLIRSLSAKDLFVEISRYNEFSFEVFTKLGFQPIDEKKNSTVLMKQLAH